MLAFAFAADLSRLGDKQPRQSIRPTGVREQRGAPRHRRRAPRLPLLRVPLTVDGRGDDRPLAWLAKCEPVMKLKLEPTSGTLVAFPGSKAGEGTGDVAEPDQRNGEERTA